MQKKKEAQGQGELNIATTNKEDNQIIQRDTITDKDGEWE